MNNIYYYGCISGPGHYLFNADLQLITSLEEQSLYSKLGLNHIDWDLSIRPSGPEIGKVKVTYLNSYTILSFYDSTHSSGPNCHSTYIIEGAYEFSQALSLCQDKFPSIFSRYIFKIELESSQAAAA